MIITEQMFHETQDELEALPMVSSTCKFGTTLLPSRTKDTVMYYIRMGVASDSYLAIKFGLALSVLVELRKEMINDE